MNSKNLPTGISKLLRAFEQRLLSLLLVYGLGRILVATAALLALLYGLDRLFQPPAWFRLALLAIALIYLARIALNCLWRPLRSRPANHDLAALLERHHPGLRDLLATAVEHDVPRADESQALKQAVARRAEKAVASLDLKIAAPAGAARRSAWRGLGLSAALVALSLLAPTEASIFMQRLFGSQVAWPQETQLLLLAPYSASSGESLELIQSDDEHFELHVARGMTINLRVRAEGVVPEQVFAVGTQGRRAMQPMGGGEFVLRLPSVDVDSSWSFVGGDDQNGSPYLQLLPGNPPAVNDWQVKVEPPTYTGLTHQQSSANEFRLPQGSKLSLRFKADLPVETAWLRHLDGTRVELLASDDAWQYEFVADQSGELVFELQGTDGFLNRSAAMLRWTAEPDHKPRINFLFPDRRWTAVSGSPIPMLMQASDDYGLSEVVLAWSEPEESWTPEMDSGRLDWKHFELLVAPLPSAENFGGDFRTRVEAQVTDFGQPFAQTSSGNSPWIQVLSADSFDLALAERMVRVRERVEDQLARLAPLLEESAVQNQEAAAVARRLDRELDGLLRDLEYSMLERIYSGLDRSSGPLQQALSTLLSEGPPGAGQSLLVLNQPGLPPLLDRSKLLFELARTAASTKQGPSQALRQATANRTDFSAPAIDLRDGLQGMLDALLAWEDYQSAVNLLRGLLDRQRSLYLRTLEASGR